MSENSICPDTTKQKDSQKERPHTSPHSLPACRLKKSVWEIQRKIYISVHINACAHIRHGAGTDRPRMANQTVWKLLGLLMEISHAIKNLG